MNFQENREFIKYYVTEVLEDLGPMMKTLIESGKHTNDELQKIFFDHVNKVEFQRFCDIFNDINCCIDEEYMEPQSIIDNYESTFRGVWEYDDYLDVYNLGVEIYLEEIHLEDEKKSIKK